MKHLVLSPRVDTHHPLSDVPAAFGDWAPFTGRVNENTTWWITQRSVFIPTARAMTGSQAAWCEMRSALDTEWSENDIWGSESGGQMCETKSLAECCLPAIVDDWVSLLTNQIPRTPESWHFRILTRTKEFPVKGEKNEVDTQITHLLNNDNK